MHPAATFRVAEKAEALAFIAAHPFATLAVNGASGPVMALVPLVIDSSGQNLLGHVARTCLLYTSPSPRDATLSRMPSSA